MALVDKQDLSTDSVFGLGDGQDKLQSIEGYYLGNREVKTANGDSIIHVFKTPKGNVGIWGTAKLNSNLGTEDLGVFQSITYKGKVRIAGGKTQHTYRFQSDSDDTIEVAQLSKGSSTANVELVDGDDGDDTDFDANEQLVAAQKQAKVQAMLNKNKKQA
jgi:hypothetical protein